MTLYRIIGYGRTLIYSSSWIDLSYSQLDTSELRQLRELAIQAGYSELLLSSTRLSEERLKG